MSFVKGQDAFLKAGDQSLLSTRSGGLNICEAKLRWAKNQKLCVSCVERVNVYMVSR